MPEWRLEAKTRLVLVCVCFAAVASVRVFCFFFAGNACATQRANSDRHALPPVSRFEKSFVLVPPRELAYI